MKIILASNSPRRRELLSKITENFSVIPSRLGEHSDAQKPEEVVMDLATQKAQSVYEAHPDALVIGCDTVVDLNGKILGKPSDYADATKMLQALSDCTHFVHTGVCVLCSDFKKVFCDTTAVKFRKLSSEEIDGYVKSGAPMDKAGAYGIQECGFVESYDGSYDNVVGLPTEKLFEILNCFLLG